MVRELSKQMKNSFKELSIGGSREESDNGDGNPKILNNFPK